MTSTMPEIANNDDLRGDPQDVVNQIIYAIYHNDAKLLKRLYAQFEHKFFISANKQNFLRLAALCGSAESIDLLLKAGAKADDNEALCYAASQNQADCIMLLLDAGARVDNLNLARKPEDNPLFVAISNSSIRALQILLIYGADPNKRLSDELSPAMYATFLKKWDALAELLKYGAKLTVADAIPYLPDHNTHIYYNFINEYEVLKNRELRKLLGHQMGIFPNRSYIILYIAEFIISCPIYTCLIFGWTNLDGILRAIDNKSDDFLSICTLIAFSISALYPLLFLLNSILSTKNFLFQIYGKTYFYIVFLIIVCIIASFWGLQYFAVACVLVEVIMRGSFVMRYNLISYTSVFLYLKGLNKNYIIDRVGGEIKTPQIVICTLSVIASFWGIWYLCTHIA